MPRPLGLAGEFRIVLGPYALGCVPDGLPPLFNRYVGRAVLAEKFALDQPNLCCVTARRTSEEWPFLVVAQSFHPAGTGFEPGLLLVPETDRLFVGAGERILAYDLATPRRLWVDSAESGFWEWAQHSDIVLMSAELELAAWTTAGEKLWTTFVEPPWSYSVQGETVRLDVMGHQRTFSIRTGPV